MNKLKKFALSVCAVYAALLIFDFAWIRVTGQTPPQNAWGATIAGSGSDTVLGMWDGSGWTVVGQ